MMKTLGLLLSRKPKTSNEGNVTLRPEADVNQLLTDATEATGKSRNDLVNRCVRASIADVVADLLENQRAAQKRFFGSVERLAEELAQQTANEIVSSSRKREKTDD